MLENKTLRKHKKEENEKLKITRKITGEEEGNNKIKKVTIKNTCKMETPAGQERQVDEICAICEKFGYYNEIWGRCRSCATWAHAD